MISKAMAMLDTQTVMQAPVPVVDPEHVRRWWEFQAQHAGPGVSISMKVMEQVCDLGADDPLAVWARTVIIFVLMQQGALANGKLPDGVLKPLRCSRCQTAFQKFDPDEFLKTLDQKRGL